MLNHWTKEETETLISKYNKMTNSQLAELFPSYKRVDVEAMKSLRDMGTKVSDVCREFGIAKTTYYQKMKEYGNGNQ